MHIFYFSKILNSAKKKKQMKSKYNIYLFKEFLVIGRKLECAKETSHHQMETVNVKSQNNKYV